LAAHLSDEFHRRIDNVEDTKRGDRSKETRGVDAEWVPQALLAYEELISLIHD